MHDTPTSTPTALSMKQALICFNTRTSLLTGYPWGEEALERARREQKPILLSIGYSACHWCHVMERESFENEEIAAVMNELFINIKVDREERPDLDEIYMNAVQVMTRQGGWPMTVFLTPDPQTLLRGNLLFTPTDRYGRPGFPKVMEAVAEAFKDKHTQVLEQADQLTAQLNQINNVVYPHEQELTEQLMQNAFQHYRSQFDSHHGGFGNAPKFPPSMGLPFLLSLLAPQWQRQCSGDGRTHTGEDGTRGACMTNSVVVSIDTPPTHTGLSHTLRRCFTTTRSSSLPILRRTKPRRNPSIGI